MPTFNATPGKYDGDVTIVRMGSNNTIDPAILEALLPYTGATADLNLGNHSIYLNGESPVVYIQGDVYSGFITECAGSRMQVRPSEITFTDKQSAGQNYKSLLFGPSNNFTDNYFIFLPNKNGIVALTSDYLLIEPLTLSQRTALLPSAGRVVYQTDGVEGLYQYKSTGWEVVGGSIYSSNGTLTGNRIVSMVGYTLTFTNDITVAGNTIGSGLNQSSTNVAFGSGALASTTSGITSVAIGYNALNLMTTSGSNVAIGYRSLSMVTSGGTGNVAIGTNSMPDMTSGDGNVAIGSGVAVSAASGVSYNVVIGLQAGYNLSSGAQFNTLVGKSAGGGITSGSYNTIIGAQVTGLSAGLANNVIIADGQGNQRINVNASGSVGMGTGVTVAASAKLELSSTTQGFLPPRMTNAQRTAITSPAVGLIVYCTDATIGLYIYKATGWTFIV